jgi:hypothetical protein
VSKSSQTSQAIDVVTHSGQRIKLREIKHWLDVSSKDGSEKILTRRELRTSEGRAAIFNGSLFELPNGDTFDPPS